jgi:hypothetical protein
MAITAFSDPDFGGDAAFNAYIQTGPTAMQPPLVNGSRPL